MGKRDENIEMLRAISCMAVIILHVNAWCFQIENLAIHLRNVNDYYLHAREWPYKNVELGKHIILPTD